MGRQPVSIFKVVAVQYVKMIILFFCLCLVPGCEDFLTGENLDSNPNKVDDVDQVSVEALFVGSQVTLYGVMEGYLSRLVTMFMQQLGGQLYSTRMIISVRRLTGGWMIGGQIYTEQADL